MMPRASKIVRFLSAPQVAVMLDYRRADERLEGSIILPKVYARSMVLCGEDVDLMVVICAWCAGARVLSFWSRARQTASRDSTVDPPCQIARISPHSTGCMPKETFTSHDCFLNNLVIFETAAFDALPHAASTC